MKIGKARLLVLLLFFTSFYFSVPMVIATDPNIITATITNWDAGANCLCMKREYIFRVWVSDDDGATNISKVYMRGTNSSDDIIFEVRADNLNSTPSWSIETGEDVIDLNTDNCYWVEDGDYGYAYFYIRFEWDCPLSGNCGIFVYVEDSDGNSVGWQQERDDFYDIIPKLVIENLAVTDTRDNIGESNRVTGYLSYVISYDSNTSLMIAPPESEFNIIHIHDESHVSVANTTTLDEVTCIFQSGTFNIPNSAQLNTYHVYVDMVDNYTDGDSPDGDIVTIIGDRYNITSLWSSDYSPPANETFTLYAEIESEYDGHEGDVSDSLVIEGLSFDYDDGYNRFYTELNISEAGTHYFDTLDSFYEATYGITSASFGHNLTISVLNPGEPTGWPSNPSIPSMPNIPSTPTDDAGGIAPISPYVNLGIILIVGSVIFALSWKGISDRDQSSLKKFQSRREGTKRTSKEKEKQVPKKFKNRRK